MYLRTITAFIVFFIFPFSTIRAAEKEKSAAKDTVEHKRLEKIFHSFSARSIGPAIMGGRVSDIAFDPVDIYSFYVGLATGGIMKTSNNGVSFDAIFEHESVASIGAIAIAPSNAKYIYVGTGEANDRNSSGWGNGVYLSTDGGGSWRNIGLKESKTIARIVVHPKDSLTAFVAAMGDLWKEGGERGLYKTTDAGKNWKKILSAETPQDKFTGCGDVVIDATDSAQTIIYAALYARQRTPWSFTQGVSLTEGKDAGGIFKSTDAGASWKKLENGLPLHTQRIGFSTYKKNQKIIFAVVQSDEGGASSIDDVTSKTGGVFKSEDAGEHWTRVNALNPRPFYFSQIRVDPMDSQKVYLLGYMVHVSLDGGKTFREDYFEKVHPDCHALVIDEKNPKRMLLGTDGGVYQSFGGGKGWFHINSFAAGEYYRIAVDNSTPYRIAGGLQDNQNWVGPSKTNSRDGILNSHWTNIGGGDGFYCVFDPFDSNVVYAESQSGYVYSFNMRSGFGKGIRPEPEEGQEAFRFHWNSSLIGSTHSKGILYLAGNRIFKLWEQGEKWKVISPDLSKRDVNKILTTGSGAENYGVVYTLCESPVVSGMLWAGTDDGKLWLTENEGESWKDLSDNLPKNVKGFWVSRIEASHFDANVAYIAIDAHRSGDYAPYLFRTSDKGKSWQSISSTLPHDGPAKVIREDIKNPDLLFAGTEFSLFFSTNRGSEWIKFGGLPTVAVDDIVIQPQENDLVIATHGRSLYIIDDISPLQLFADSVQKKDAYFFEVAPTFATIQLPGSSDWAGARTYRGANPADGAYLNYFIKEYTGDGVKFTIADSSGNIVANVNGGWNPGFNRALWDMRWSGDLLTGYGGEGQKFVRAGEYTITMNYGKITQEKKIKISVAAGIETK